MPPGQRDNSNNSNNLPAPSPPARTAFTLVPGYPAARVEDRWEVEGDSPLVSSLPF